MDILWLTNMTAVFLLCIVCAGFLIPEILLIAYKRHLFDEPNERKIHTSAVPRLGGIAFMLVVFFSLALVLGINLVSGHERILDAMHGELETLVFCFCAVMLLYIVGIADDLVGIKYRAKFFTQIVCGAMIIAGGLSLCDLNGLFLLHEIPSWAGYPLTVFAIVFIINSINLIDGIDGLASGLCSTAFITYGSSFLIMGEYLYATIAFANLGVLLPFFYYNVFGDVNKHSKIFMGDTGALTIGMSLCILSLKIAGCHPEGLENVPNLFVVAFAPMLVPCMDVVRVYMRRVRKGKNPFLPDKSHIHHKLLDMGMKQRPAMIAIVGISFLLIVVNCVASIHINVNFLLVFDALFVTFTNIWLSGRIKK